MRKYYSLAAHNSACNEFFYRYQDCQYEHPFRKYLGYCNDFEKQMRMCIKEQRNISRNRNWNHSREKINRMRREVKEKEMSD